MIQRNWKNNLGKKKEILEIRQEKIQLMNMVEKMRKATDMSTPTLNLKKIIYLNIDQTMVVKKIKKDLGKL